MSISLASVCKRASSFHSAPRYRDLTENLLQAWKCSWHMLLSATISPLSTIYWYKPLPAEVRTGKDNFYFEKQPNNCLLGEMAVLAVLPVHC